MSIPNSNINEKQQRRVFIITIVFLVAITANLILSLSQGFQTNAWQHFVRAGLVLIFGITTVIAATWIRRGRTENGVWLLIIGFLSTLTCTSLLLAGFGVILAAIELVLAGGITAFVLPKGKRNRGFIITFVAAALTYGLDFLPLAYRIPAPVVLKGALPVIAGFVVLIMGFFMARQAWSGGLRNKLMIVLAGTIVVLVGAITTFNIFNTQQESKEVESKALNQLYVDYNDNIALQEDAAAMLSISLSEREEIKNLFLAGDREGLLTLLTPMFENLKEEYDIRHLYVEDTEGVVYVRVHNPAKYGDDVTYRRTAAASLEAQETVAGVEIGPGRIGIRSVSPLFNTGEFIGMVEVGIDYDQTFIDEFKAKTGADYTLWITNEAAAPAGLNPEENAFASPHSEMFFYSSTFSEPYPISADVYEQVLTTGEPNLQVVSVGDEEYTVLVSPMIGYGDRIIGIVEISNSRADVLSAIQMDTRSHLITAGILLVLGLVATWFATQYLVTRPLFHLTGVAQRQVEGDLDARTQLETNDEFEVLASTFNSMTSQLQETLGGLEQRVAERTQNLELAAEVGRSVSQVRNLDVMLKDACDLVLKEFDLYYVQVYLTDPGQTNLVLEAGTGDVGTQLLSRGHSLPLNTASINGRAAMEKRTVVISDTAESPTFRPNPLLPETRGEMAVPLVVGQNVVGVLDMQTTIPGVLNEEVLPAFEALAGQLAVAVQNANLVAEAEQARAEVEAQARRLVREGWDEHLDAIHKPEQFGYVFDRDEVTSLEDVEETALPEDGQAVSAPISLTGEMLGSLVVEVDEERQNEQTSELVNTVARQVAQQLENLRLLESSERYRFEAEQATRRQTREGWLEYIQSRTEDSLGYLYDRNKVHPHSNGKDDPNALTLPLKARDETIGKLAVKGIESDDKESFDLANAVAERLGDHIESLRLFEETKQGQVELENRARQLAAVAEVSTASSQELDIQQLLATVVNLTKERFNLYHAHVYLLDETADSLVLAAGAGDVGRQMVAEGWQIDVDHQSSLVARAAHTQQSMISNDIVRDKDSEFLSNRLLPDTRSELAVPLIVGDKLLGVFDVQSDRGNAFTEEDANIQMTLASQIATALQNARSFAQAQKQAERETMLNSINQKIQSATSVEAVLQIAARELGHALGAPMTIAQLSMKDKEN